MISCIFDKYCLTALNIIRTNKPLRVQLGIRLPKEVRFQLVFYYDDEMRASDFWEGGGGGEGVGGRGGGGLRRMAEWLKAPALMVNRWTEGAERFLVETRLDYK